MKLNCYIVEDLLPSYIEDLTSIETTRDVEEHMAACINCRDSLEIMKNKVALPDSIDLQKSAENKNDFSYLSKIRSYYTKKFSISLFLFIVFMILFLDKFFSSPYFSVNGTLNSLFILVPTFIVFLYNLQSDVFYADIKKSTFHYTISIALICSTLLGFYIMYMAKTWVDIGFPFNIPPHKAGPVYSHIFFVIKSINSLLFILGLYNYIKERTSYFYLSTYSLLNIIVVLSFSKILMQLDHIDTYSSLVSKVSLLYLEGIALIGILFMISKYKSTREKTLF